MTSVLENKIIKPLRPYSQKELSIMRQRLYKWLRLSSSTKAQYQKCGHFYYVKENGRKEKMILEHKHDDTNCSVCWKINKTPRHLKNRAVSLVEAYTDILYQEPEFLTWNIIDLETSFYKYLYLEFNR